MVDQSLRVKGVKNIFAAGDIAAAQADDAHMALMSCQHAMPMGGHAGYNAVHSLLSLPHRKYSQPNYVTCIDLGEAGGLLTNGWEREIKMTGQDAKNLKTKINEDYIYPPEGSAENIMSKAHIDAQWGNSRS
jgi:NADH dehydrogenase